jgi:hypothetical protein
MIYGVVRYNLVLKSYLCGEHYYVIFIYLSHFSILKLNQWHELQISGSFLIASADLVSHFLCAWFISPSHVFVQALIVKVNKIFTLDLELTKEYLQL